MSSRIVLFVPSSKALSNENIAAAVIAELIRHWSEGPRDADERAVEAVEARKATETHPRLFATSYHESGHAVVSLALGYPPRQVHVIPDHTSWGTTRNSRIVDPLADIAATLGGPMSEALATGLQPQLPNAKDGDLFHIAKAARRAADPGAVVSQGIKLASAMLVLHWPAVRRVARRLMDQGRLYQTEIMREVCDA